MSSTSRPEEPATDSRATEPVSVHAVFSAPARQSIRGDLALLSKGNTEAGGRAVTLIRRLTGRVKCIMDYSDDVLFLSNLVTENEEARDAITTALQILQSHSPQAPKAESAPSSN